MESWPMETGKYGANLRIKISLYNWIILNCRIRSVHVLATRKEEFNASTAKLIGKQIIAWKKISRKRRNAVINQLHVSAEWKKILFARLKWIWMISSSTGTCKGLQKLKRITADGDYYLTVRGRKVLVYCHRMNTTNPQEYISLKGSHERHTIFVEIWAFSLTKPLSIGFAISRFSRELFVVLWAPLTQ